MGHAHHFLSRLDRVSLPQVELALSLYNDVPLLQYVLQRVSLPEGAPRVAISLDHPSEGPFLVITREGRFVTCLGAGMSTGDLPIISRGQLDGVAARVTELRGKLTACATLAGRLGGVGKLMLRLHEAGDELSREEFTAIAGLQPLYPIEMFKFYLGATKDLEVARDILLRELRRSDRLKPVFRETLRLYWNTFWSVGHFALLTAADGFGPFASTAPEIIEGLEHGSLSWCAVRQGEVPLAIRGAWAVGRMGKPLLAGYKRLLREAESPLQVMSAGSGLAALALRHSRLSAEASKALSSGPDVGPPNPLARKLHAMTDVIAAAIAPALEAPEVMAGIHKDLGAKLVTQETARLPKGAPLRFEREEDVPEDLALSMAVNTQGNFMTDITLMTPMLLLLGWAARAKPEQLYLPAEYIRAVHVPWQPEMTLRFLRAYRDYYKTPQGKPEGPSRQGPCPCGSGKKYKRCCEEKKAAEKAPEEAEEHE